MQRKADPKRVYSRRDLLSRVPLAVAGGLILGAVLGRPLLSQLNRRRRAPVFPEGSIFTPAKDPRDKA